MRIVFCKNSIRKHRTTNANKNENMNFKLKRKTSRAFSVIAFLLMNFYMKSNKVNAAEQNFTSLIIYRDYLSNMANIMDREIMPCMNFFQHACGNFENYQEYLVEERDVEPLFYNKQDHYMFFDTYRDMFKTKPGVLLRNTYDMCKSGQKQNGKKRKNWLRMINDIPFLKPDYDLLRKWPFLQYQWEKYERKLNLKWPALAAEFSAHGLNIFFNVFFAENTIYVTPNDDLQCKDFNEFKASILPLLGTRNAQIADIIGGELWLLCRQLKGEIALSAEIENATNLLNDDTMGEFFQYLFPRLNFTELEIENSRKIMVFIDKLSETMALLRLTNPRIIYNFILWQAFEHLTNIQDCYELAQEFEDLVQLEYWNWSPFQSHFKRDVALASYLFHTTRFQKYYRQFVTSNSWERLFQNRSERKDLNIERTIKNYAKQYLDLEKYTKHYQSDLFTKERPTFYSFLLEMRRLKLRFSFLNSHYESEDLNFFQEFINFSILLVYRPRLHYFASYDREMWQNSEMLENSDGYYTAVDCLQHQTTLNSEDSDIYEDLTMEQMKEIYNFYLSFNKALGDYKFWLESENFAIAEDFLLEYFQMDSLRVIFYAVAQQFCGRNDNLYSSLINRSYMNMPEFQEAFQCESIDEMNPVTKCMLD